jgi:hypothetical protein
VADVPAPSAPTPAPLSTSPLAGQDSSRSRGLTGWQAGGIAVGAVGLAGVGVGAAFGFAAMAKNSDSKAFCSPSNPDFCTAQGQSDRSAAIAAGNISTAGFIAGGVLAATGITMAIVGRRREGAAGTPSASSASKPWVEARPMVGAQAIGGILQGSF